MDDDLKFELIHSGYCLSIRPFQFDPKDKFIAVDSLLHLCKWNSEFDPLPFSISPSPLLKAPIRVGGVLFFGKYRGMVILYSTPNILQTLL